jgi:hypothetical protein
MYRCNLAYRHDNGDIEGFVGHALGDKAAAERDCIKQMQRKCDMIKGFGKTPFSMDRVIRSDTTLTAAEIEQVKQDWLSNHRY